VTKRCVAGACEEYVYGDGRNPTTIKQRDGRWIVQEFNAADRLTRRQLGYWR
jgi:hypothetical protein